MARHRHPSPPKMAFSFLAAAALAYASRDMETTVCFDQSRRARVATGCEEGSAPACCGGSEGERTGSDNLPVRKSPGNSLHMRVNSSVVPLRLQPASICSRELARAAANARSQITSSEQSRLHPPIWTLICPNLRRCFGPNPQRSLIPL